MGVSTIRIVICYSVAGGTGSGSHLMMSYLLQDLANQIGKAFVLGVAVLPSVFEDKAGTNKDGIFANGYAALKETEHLMKLGAPESAYWPEEGRVFHYDPSDVSKRSVTTKPFEFLYIVDKPEDFTVDKVVDAAGDGLYLQLYSPLFGVQAGDYDNYTQHQRFLVPHDFEARGIQGYTSFYGSYGAAVLVVPDEGLLDYCSRAAALSILKQSFVDERPAAATYDQVSHEDFNTVLVEDDAKVTVAEIDEYEDLEQKGALQDGLFARRIALLADAEHKNGKRGGAFLRTFRHGHSIESFPTRDGKAAPLRGGAKEEDALLTRAKASFNKKPWTYSVYQQWANSFGHPGKGNGDAPIVEWAESEMGRKRDPFQPFGDEKKSYGDLRNAAKRWQDKLEQAGLQALEEGSQDEAPGYRWWNGLSCFDDAKKAQDVGLIDRRYFLIRLSLALAETITELGEDDENPGSTSPQLTARTATRLLRRTNGRVGLEL